MWGAFFEPAFRAPLTPNVMRKEKLIVSKSFPQLPGHLKRYISQFGWAEDKLESWLSEPIPALGNRSILQSIEDGALPQVNQVVLRVGDALGIEGNFDFLQTDQ